MIVAHCMVKRGVFQRFRCRGTEDAEKCF